MTPPADNHGTWAAKTAEGAISAPRSGTLYFRATGGTIPRSSSNRRPDGSGFHRRRAGRRSNVRCQCLGHKRVSVQTREFKLQFLDGSGADVGAAFTTGEFGPNNGTWVEQTMAALESGRCSA
jgi:hypothetical protein